ncbi:hypothetical protein BTR22_19170 [Alkalihalophilus pseudofirmus]|uniref:head decoration protein n=1 Tax=Alkalihalophilus pseudofirmus TaxID=79885 RepID=UPI000952377C|nr:hypothetical protein BTR22_19170 [Alkalihalophilus pseudofirmus]
MEQLHEQIGEYHPDNLIAGIEMPLLVKGVTLEKGQGLLVRGTVVALKGDSGHSVRIDSGSEDGGTTPYGILTDTINTDVDEDVVTTCYVSGVFNQNALVFGGSDTYATHEEKLREKGIFLKENVAY